MFKKLGLTKNSLAIHTQKEEWSFMNKCKEIKKFHIFKCACSCYFRKRPKGCPGEHGMFFKIIIVNLRLYVYNSVKM